MRRALVVALLVLAAAAPAHADVFFLDAGHGWASGDGGVLGTSDGGRSWTLLERRRGELAALQFLDLRRGFALAGGTLVATADGGRSWRVVRAHATALAYPWLVTSSSRLARTDGRPVTAPAPVESVCAAGGTTVWTASGGRLFVSRDGGRTWTKAFVERADAGGPGWRASLECRGPQVWALFTGGAATSHQAYVVAHSADGGRTWTQPLAQGWYRLGQRAQIDAYSGPFAIAGGDGFFSGRCDPCGGRGRITLTAGDGTHFRRATIGEAAGRSVDAVAFPDTRHGFLQVGSSRRGVVLATADGGRTWRPVLASPLLRQP